MYFKESEQIEDILTLMGAQDASLELMNIKILKDIRNKANRITNCESANIDKTVAAAAVHVEAVRKIQASCGLEALPEELRELARLRLEHPGNIPAGIVGSAAGTAEPVGGESPAAADRGICRTSCPEKTLPTANCLPMDCREAAGSPLKAQTFHKEPTYLEGRGGP